MAYPVALFLVLALSSTTLPSPALAGGIGEAYNFCSRLSEQTSSCIKPTTEDAVDLGLAAVSPLFTPLQPIGRTLTLRR